MEDLEYRLANLPERPGVYLMKDGSEEIIYVGKAKNLRNRVRQYFQSSRNMDRKVRNMVSHIRDFEYIIVDNEVEALILESNLIKKYRPKYNILLRDDKQYPYIKVSLNEIYPRVLKTREIKKDGARYFGPYPSVGSVNDALDIIREMYPIRNCNRYLDGSRTEKRPCLNYFIGQCIGPCLGNVPVEDYMAYIEEIILFLEGREDILKELISSNMLKASKELRFEDAAKYRDQLLSIENLKEKQKIISTKTTVDQDVIGLASGIEEVCVQIFFIREGKIVGREHFIIEDTFSEEKKNIISSFIKQFYMGAAYIPKEIIIEEAIEDGPAIEKWLSQVKSSKVTLTVPQKGDKKKLLEMVKLNARDMINKYGDRFLRQKRKNQEALAEIQELLGLENSLERIEAFDISNISGVQSVGSMVVFENGQPKKSDYRRFKIKSLDSKPDDYASMEEVLRRRFTRGIEERRKAKEEGLDLQGFSAFPDLIMMDGGKGQVNIALRVLYDLGIDIPVSGLVKDSSHTTRGIIYNNREIRLKEDSPGFRLIYRVQEEAHRFAISYHRSLRSKDMFRSELDGIKGIGPKRKKDLLKHFKSIEKIKKAEIDELLEIESMNKTAATQLYLHFRK